MNVLQKIFNDHFEEMLYILHPRDSVIENVERMMDCGNPAFGGAMYGCPSCGNLKFVPFRCRSRFCPTCGVKYSLDRTTSMSFRILNTSHRHCVFTIDDRLRPLFLKDRSLLDCLFQAVRSTIYYLFHKQNKSLLFTPGFICVLHTFGRDLKWNPHIHCLISEGALANHNTTWRKITHFNYTLLRNSFRTALLNLLEKRLGSSFKKLKAACYKDHPHGFYVYAKPNHCQPHIVMKYIGRYLGRPAIALSRIDSYDGNFVTFHYNRHEDEKLVSETIPVLDFIERLIQHIPQKHFKQIRYYGLYAKPKDSVKHLRHAISKEKHEFFLSLNRWRTLILGSFGYDPLKCPICHTPMLFMELYFKHQRISLPELYEKTMRKHRKIKSPPHSSYHR